VRGVLISLEGTEGAGKSTQARLLFKHLKARGMSVVLTHEPGGTAIGQRIREVLLSTDYGKMDPVTELLLYAASRRQHLTEVILPSLRNGSVVITDRFSDSTLAYQGHARGIGPEVLLSMDEIATGGLRPDLTVLLDVDTKEGLARNRNAKKLDRLELEEMEFHEKVRAGFLKIMEAEPERVRLVSSSGGIHETHEEVVGVVMGFIGSEGDA
jgi:dTMP kinase